MPPKTIGHQKGPGGCDAEDNSEARTMGTGSRGRWEEQTTLFQDGSGFSGQKVFFVLGPNSMSMEYSANLGDAYKKVSVKGAESGSALSINTSLVS